MCLENEPHPALPVRGTAHRRGGGRTGFDCRLLRDAGVIVALFGGAQQQAERLVRCASCRTAVRGRRDQSMVSSADWRLRTERYPRSDGSQCGMADFRCAVAIGGARRPSGFPSPPSPASGGWSVVQAPRSSAMHLASVGRLTGADELTIAATDWGPICIVVADRRARFAARSGDSRAGSLRRVLLRRRASRVCSKLAERGWRRAIRRRRPDARNCHLTLVV